MIRNEIIKITCQCENDFFLLLSGSTHAKFDVTDKEIVEIISRWFMQGKLRNDRDL